MSFTNISPAELAELCKGGKDRTDRRAHAGRIPGGPRRIRPQSSPWTNSIRRP